MIRLAANLSMMFTDLPFLDRFAAAAAAGFSAVEFLFPYSETPEAIAEALNRHDLELVLFNFPAGRWDGGERGVGALPDRVADFQQDAERALAYARHLGCKRLHLLAGITTGFNQADCTKVLIGNIRHAADLVAPDGIDILLEPINTKVDIPGYFYDTTSAVMEIIAKVDRSNVRLQYDIYHMQIMEGDLARSIARLLPSIGHMQLADNPGRGTPGTGEINFAWLLDHIEALGYNGYIGCEYRPPDGSASVPLSWAAPYLKPSIVRAGD
jgi:hydroxypyruvate isomerase